MSVLLVLLALRAVAAFSTDSDLKWYTCTVSCCEDPVVFEIHLDWSPLGSERFVELVENGFFDEMALYRVVPNFLVQFGVPSTAEQRRFWNEKGMLP